MNKTELISAVAKQAGLKAAEASRAVEAVFDAIIQATAKGEDVRLVGFGSFVRANRAAREARNPRTGATLRIPATRVPRFRPGKEYKESVA